ncbi:hypothetical protein HOC37_03880 [bacterium]|nr:hypothetical protein [bacterium]MBT3581312.1 hypothetical protein [bacterium]MBT4552108.1 hypothetical protein [bacterium]MBT5989118.1 hypothetical protein [bacterium]MBT7088097.1 hypothetical protein [bacterium]
MEENFYTSLYSRISSSSKTKKESKRNFVLDLPVLRIESLKEKRALKLIIEKAVLKMLRALFSDEKVLEIKKRNCLEDIYKKLGI